MMPANAHTSKKFTRTYFENSEVLRAADEYSNFLLIFV